MYSRSLGFSLVARILVGLLVPGMIVFFGYPAIRDRMISPATAQQSALQRSIADQQASIQQQVQQAVQQAQQNIQGAVAQAQTQAGTAAGNAGSATAFAATMAAQSAALKALIKHQRAAQAALEAHGIPGTAQLVSVRQTNTMVYGNTIGQLMVIHLAVSIPGHATYQATISQAIPLANLAGFNPGGIANVRVDSSNLHHLDIISCCH